MGKRWNKKVSGNIDKEKGKQWNEKVSGNIEKGGKTMKWENIRNIDKGKGKNEMKWESFKKIYWV